MKPDPQTAPAANATLRTQLTTLSLLHLREHYEPPAAEAARKKIGHVDYLAELIEGELHRRDQRSLERRVRDARLPMLKGLDTFDWGGPKKINREQLQNLFRMAFLADHTNVVLVSNVGLGKTHLMIALAHAACLRAHSVRFTTAVEIINTLTAAQRVGSFKREMAKYVKPTLLAIDEPVIVAGTNLAAFPAKRATSTIPIVVIASHGAVETGLIASYARPGGNVTGIESLAPELDVKRLELLRETLPKARMVAVLSNPQDLGTALHQRWSQEAAEALELKLVTVPVSRAAEFEPALAGVAAQRADAMLVFTDSILFAGMAQMTAFSHKNRIPLFAEFRQFTDAGGLMSYGASLNRMVRDSARYIDRIVKGSRPSDLPVERPTEFELVINQKTASALGITVPHAVLLRADEVIR